MANVDVQGGQKAKGNARTNMSLFRLLMGENVNVMLPYKARNKRRERMKVITLDHHVYDHITGWSKQCSKEQPFLKLSANMPQEDYEHFGLA